MAINNVKVVLDVPSSFKIKQPLINIPVIEAKNSRGVDFYLEPKQCGTTTIGGTVIYKDATGEQHTINIRKTININLKVNQKIKAKIKYDLSKPFTKISQKKARLGSKATRENCKCQGEIANNKELIIGK